ncbi:hypothetical protein RRX38_02825 [Pseudomonas sp. DTU_2021_1001937_2_SI_NGA_ILE_001]|uniref:DnaT-like ssDNA-binding protein n=1 Tax=Pseudomonas sp. DTU_2021_1001937_2_SI_NGA_ILE_001 TaxID=3077589 RepID=UPI0028FC16B5|nr:DnaT-like ssDNA-binding protein [Pseudomonas sp. DTU_2021_1001937_2_SI_NGA_ILE_001]WNW10123.1 hypothetical protein RRX38_02825 [Pseudomonas sp. DTU_2021_1001937_2_SI_NGA_ILE_001]
MPDDFYGTLAGADAYHAARGNAAWAASDEAAKTGALIRASAYIDGLVGQPVPNMAGRIFVFTGKKVGGYGQFLQWPRAGARDRYGEEIPDDLVPLPIEYAAYEGAIRELAEPNSLNPDFVASQVVQREKVGPIETEYAVAKNGNPTNQPVIGAINSLMFPFLVPNPVGVGVIVV